MFALYDDELMTRRAGALVGSQFVKPTTFNLAKSTVNDFVVYFGSPDDTITLKTEQNQDVDNITITPRLSLPEWQPNADYATGQAIYHNGLIFKCLSGGTSGSTMSGEKGERVADNNVIWQVIGEAYRPEAVKLALSRDGLNSAVAGAPLSLGTSVRGGAAIAIYVRVSSSVSDLYNEPNIGQIGLFINDVVVVNNA